MKIFYLSACLFMFGCSTMPKAIEPGKKPQLCTEQDEVYVLSHGWHTGIAIKADDLNKLIPALATRFFRVRYYEIGWGDAGFYQANEITTGLTLRAMFWSPGSVLHVVGFNDDPKHYFYRSEVKIIKTSHENYLHLLEFIQSSFKKDQAGNILAEKRGIYADSQFYTGMGTYQLFNTCNKWTAKALYSIGMDISPILKLTSSSVMHALNQTCLEK